VLEDGEGDSVVVVEAAHHVPVLLQLFHDRAHHRIEAVHRVPVVGRTRLH